MTFFWNDEAIKIAAESARKYTPLPSGSIVRVRINRLDDKKNSSNTGRNLKAEFEVIDGEFAGRRIFESYAYENQNLKAMEIAWRQIRALSLATFGNDNRRSLHEFLNRTLRVQTKIETFKDEEQTRVAKYFRDHVSSNTDELEF